MSKVTIKIDPKTGQNYLPRDVRKSGFVGEVEAFGSAVTLTLIRPGARVGDILVSLRLTSAEIGLLRGRIGSSGAKTDELSGAKTSRHPLFGKYSRDWLRQTLGYSKGYLCRIATGRVHLSRPFVERACFRLHESEAELFSLDADEGNSQSEN